MTAFPMCERCGYAHLNQLGDNACVVHALHRVALIMEQIFGRFLEEIEKERLKAEEGQG